MLDALRRLLTAEAAPRAAGTPGEDDDLRLAACALLVGLARADGEFSDAERHHIEEILGEQFGVPPAEAHALMTAADRSLAEAVDLHRFTSVITARYDDHGRERLAEMLWRVVDADGSFSQHEAYLIRRLGNHLDLPPGALNAARARAAGRHAG
jgi:uncharacterized tellurite resistance protein B-like protein